ncbi:MAG TPA: glycosyltransferase [Spirillospora sp.]|nr:glycosyltransferase [Spirillospora sp.]
MLQRTEARGLRVAWVDTMRYTRPLDESQAKKWQRLTQDLGVEIYVTSFAPGARPRRFDQHAHFYLWPALPLAPLRYLTAYLIAPPLALWLILARRVEVLIAHDPYIGAAAALAKNLARLLGRRVGLVVETRGDLEQGLFMQRTVRFKGLWRALMRLAGGYALRHADALRAVSASSRQQIQALAPDKPLVQFMSWTDSTAFTEVVPEKPPSQRCDIVYSGVLVLRKGVHVLLDAFARIHPQLAPAHLWLIGKAANADYAAKLREQVARLGLTDSVTFVDHLPQAELAQYMARARVFVLPTYSEGLPKVVIEAMLCGTPVVASAVDGIPEIVQDGVQGYLVPPGDVDALADRLLHVFHSADVDTLGQQARDFATRFYSPEAYIEHYGRLFVLAYRQAHSQDGQLTHGN